MSLIGACSDLVLSTGACHGTTTVVGRKAYRPCQAIGCPGSVCRGPALCAVRASAGVAWRVTGTDGCCPRHRTCDGGSVPSQGATALDAPGPIGSVMGWSSARRHERRAEARIPRALGRVRSRRRHADRRAAACGFGPAAGASRFALGVYRLLARHGWRKVAPDTRHPKSDPLTQELWKKNCPMFWKPSAIPQRSVAGESA